jgi:formate/nitrite transporter FocA (FNT family)
MRHIIPAAPPPAIAARDADQDGAARENEDRTVDHLSAPAGAIVYKAINQEGEDELNRTTAALAWSGLAAGLSMGFSFATEGLLRAHLPEAGWVPLVAKLGYSIGFLIVILGRQQLFTENTLTVILPLLRKRDAATVRNVARLWSAVLSANLIGAWAFAIVAGWTPVFDATVRPALLAIGRDAMASPFPTVLLRGVFAGWLIALMVWLLPYAETGRIWIIVVITYVVGLAHFSHVIAGSVEAFYLVARGERSFLEYIVGYLVPSLIGNVFGGVSLVAALAHAQFVAQPGGARA